MRRDGKYQYDTGRARCLRAKDRAQFEFDDMLIEDYLAGDAAPVPPGRSVPVRFGAGKLADHLSDSTIAAAILRGDSPEENPADETLTVTDFFEEDLFDLVARDNSAAVVEGPAEETKTAAPIIVKRLISPGRSAVQAPCSAGTSSDAQTEAFTIRGLVQGFLVGAGACGAVLLILRLVS